MPRHKLGVIKLLLAVRVLLIGYKNVKLESLNLPLSHTKAVCSSSSSESIIILASFLDYFFLLEKNISEELGPFTDVIKDQGSVVLSI